MAWKFNTPKFEFLSEISPLDPSAAWFGHCLFAYDLVRNTNPARVVELGTHYGYSFFSMCQAVKDARGSNELVAVDTWAGDAHAGRYSEEVFGKVQKIKEAYYSREHITLMRTTFDRASMIFKEKSIDLLHIDGLHTYEAVKHDFETWIGKVKDGGIILLHDTVERKEDFGVFRLWAELEKKYPVLLFTHSHGLGVVFVAKTGLEIWKKHFDLGQIIKQYYSLWGEQEFARAQEVEQLTNQSEKEKNALNAVIAKETATINEQTATINEQTATISEKGSEIAHLKKRFAEQQEVLTAEKNHLLKVIQFMESSIFWRIRKKYLKFKMLRPRDLVRVLGLLCQASVRGGWPGLRRGIKAYLRHGQEGLRDTMPVNADKMYRAWIRKNEKYSVKTLRDEAQNFSYRPLISIIIPVYNVAPKLLDACINSILRQAYENWELCLHDDASPDKLTKRRLKWWARRDKRIKVSFGTVNQHISGASNEAIKLASGKFIALVDNDDKIAPNALYEMVKALNENPKLDFIYSDEDKLSFPGGWREEPFFKPDWSPDLFGTMMYSCHLGIYRKSIIDKIGGFRKGYQGAQDYDLVLRFIEHTTADHIHHIPKILYHWRKIPGSTAAVITNKSYALEAGRMALSGYLERNHIKGRVLPGNFLGNFRIKRDIIGRPLVSIIIPFKDKASLLKQCIESILKKTEYDNYEIILVDNRSKEDETKKLLEGFRLEPKIRTLSFDKPYNFAAINNYAVSHAKGEHILMLNNDTEVISPEWLTAMLEHAQRPEVGAVGAKLLYPDGRIQHAGITMGLGIGAESFKFHPGNSPFYWGIISAIRNCSAVTGACLMVKKSLYNEVGGLDEIHFPIPFNDLDFCLKLRAKGLWNVYTPYAILYHHESATRGYDAVLRQVDTVWDEKLQQAENFFLKRWKDVVDRDPFYNPNLSRRGERMFELRE